MSNYQLSGQQTQQGIVSMLLAMAVLAAMDATGKSLVTCDLPVTQMIALRGVIVTLVLLLYLPRAGGLPALRCRPWGRQLLRVVFAFAAPLCFFAALRRTPLADATVIMFSATFMMTVLSGVLFGDVIGRRRWLMLLIGFAGVCIALRPSGNVSLVDAGLLLAGAFSYACLMLSIRWIGTSVSTFAMVFYPNLGTCLLSSATLPFVWRPVDSGTLAGILLMALLALSGHVFITRAFRMAPVPVVAPFEYTAIVWAALLGFVFFGDTPDFWLATGAAIITVSGIVSIRMERRRAG